MNEQLQIQNLLIQKFSEMRTINSSYSVRAFARRLDLQPSATNEILKGQRRISRKIAEKIADRLLLDPTERNDILKKFAVKNKKIKTDGLKNLKLNADQFQLISDGIHFAILSLIKVKDFKSDVDWIAERLNSTPLEIRKALMRLQHLNLISISDDLIITRTLDQVRTTDDIKNISLQRMHINDMEMAKEKIQNLPVDQRDFTSLTFPGNSKNLKRIKEIIRKAQDEIEELMHDEDAKDVYRICTYLFPLTKPEKNL